MSAKNGSIKLVAGNSNPVLAQEIAQQLAVAEGTVKSRINRGRAELARQIEALRKKSSL